MEIRIQEIRILGIRILEIRIQEIRIQDTNTGDTDTVRVRFWSILAVMLGLVICLTAGCSDTEEEKTAVGFDESTVFTVGNERVELAEWYLYALPKEKETEGIYGSLIWSYPVDNGETMADRIKEETAEEIIYVKTVCGQAEALGVSLSSDEEAELRQEAAGYMDSLDPEDAEKYGITEQTVLKVYEDNFLAMKVYEKLTLNIDTDIPEEQVRHMVLQYITILKYSENEDGEKAYYPEEELETIKADAESFLKEVKADPAVSMLSESGSSEYIPVEITADYTELCERLPEQMPGIAFSLVQDEINGIYETTDAYFILDCVKQTDEESTNKARIAAIEERQKELFGNEYSEWSYNTAVAYNYDLWDTISMGEE